MSESQVDLYRYDKVHVPVAEAQMLVVYHIDITLGCLSHTLHPIDHTGYYGNMECMCCLRDYLYLHLPCLNVEWPFYNVHLICLIELYPHPSYRTPTVLKYVLYCPLK